MSRLPADSKSFGSVNVTNPAKPITNPGNIYIYIHSLEQKVLYIVDQFFGGNYQKKGWFLHRKRMKFVEYFAGELS